MDMLSVALFVGLTGIILLLLALVLGKLCDTSRKIHQRGLDRDLHLGFIEQSILFFQNPGVTIPITIGLFGLLAIIVSILIAVVGAIQNMIT